MINIVFLNGYALTLGAISMSTFSIMGPHNTDLPDPFDIFPIDDTAVCFIKNVVTTPNVEVGEYTYYEDDENPTEFDRKNVLYNRPEFGDKLIIGKFCAIGANTKFIMGAANHSVSTVSTYPFSLFGGKWAKAARSTYDHRTIAARTRGASGAPAGRQRPRGEADPPNSPASSAWGTADGPAGDTRWTVCLQNARN